MESPFIKTEEIQKKEKVVPESPFQTEEPQIGNGEESVPENSNPSELSETGKKIVEIKDVKVIYNAGKNNEARALEGITLDVEAEEYIVFFGPSGCGKSTLLNIIGGLEIPTEGTVSVDGQDLSKFSARELAKFHCRRTGMIFQSYNLISTLNVLDNIILPQIFERIKPSARKETGRELLKKLGIEPFEKRLPQELSGGQQQRVGIARALINDPPIILADEAVGNLDSNSANNVLEILNLLNVEDKKTIISVTHNPEHLFYADRIFYMKDGKIIKVEVNEKRKKLKGESDDGGIKKIRTELDLLMQAYPDLSSMQLHIMMAPFKAKILVAYLLTSIETEEIAKMERVVTDRLLDRINKEDLLHALDRSATEGGLGLNKNTAIKFSEIVEEVVTKAEYLRQESPHLKDSEEDPTKKIIDDIRISLLEKYKGDLTLGQVDALNKGIEFRILNKINRNEFQEYMDRPYEKGGVGLGSRSAKNLARKMELIMLVRFGG